MTIKKTEEMSMVERHAAYARWGLPSTSTVYAITGDIQRLAGWRVAYNWRVDHLSTALLYNQIRSDMSIFAPSSWAASRHFTRCMPHEKYLLDLVHKTSGGCYIDIVSAASGDGYRVLVDDLTSRIIVW